MNAVSSTRSMKRVAHRSTDYVSEFKRRHGEEGERNLMSREAKLARVEALLSDPVDGFRRVGVGMVGPIQVQLRYQGIARNVLIEDPITPGTPIMYDILDDLGQAYFLSPTDGEVRAQVFEGKRVAIYCVRIAAFPVVRKEDLYLMRINIVEQAQDFTKQAIMEEEDSRLAVVLQAALVDYAVSAAHEVTPNHNVVEASGFFTPNSLWTAVAQTDMHMIPSGRVVVQPKDARDFYRWTIDTTGWAFKDRVVAGETITSFGEFQFQRSIMFPKGKMFLLPNPDMLGVMPILYSLDVEENPQVENFQRGWVMDEMVNFLILNPRGVASVSKG